MTSQDEPATPLADAPPHPFTFADLEMAEMYSLGGEAQ